MNPPEAHSVGVGSSSQTRKAHDPSSLLLDIPLDLFLGHRPHRHTEIASLEKAIAAHKVYGPPVMLKRRDDGNSWIVRYIANRHRVEEDQAFRVENMAQY